MQKLLSDYARLCKITIVRKRADEVESDKAKNGDLSCAAFECFRTTQPIFFAVAPTMAMRATANSSQARIVANWHFRRLANFFLFFSASMIPPSE